MSEYEGEPIPGLPGLLPPGERILWRGRPQWRALARTAFHTRLVGGYFAVLVIVASMTGGVTGTAMTATAGVLGVAVLALLAWASARTTVYTLTDKRLVLRIGVALPKCINLPLAMIEAVDFAPRPDGTGDIALKLKGAPLLGYATLWPHARAWHINRPQPTLRAVGDAERIGAMIARQCLTAVPSGQITPPQGITGVTGSTAGHGGFGEAAAA